MTEPINFINVERYWFLTWTAYGSWLPGDDRGFTGSLLDQRGKSVDHNQFATPTALPNAALQYVARRLLKDSPVVLNLTQAVKLSQQIRETVAFRNWILIAVAIMRTHVHAVVGVANDPDPDKILGDLKAYDSRCLNKIGTPRKDWWTRGGSARKLADEAAVETVVHYVRDQVNPLVIWTRMEGQIWPKISNQPAPEN